MASIGSATFTLNLDDSDFRRGLEETRQRASNLGGALSNAISIASGFILAKAAIYGVQTSIEGTLGAAFAMNSQLENVTQQFAVLLQGTDGLSVGMDRAKLRIAALYKFAAETPFETEPILQADRILQMFGLHSQETLTLVGDAAAGVGKDLVSVATYYARAVSAINSGKALDEAGMVLTEYGILTNQTRQQLEALKKSGASTSEQLKVFNADFEKFNGMMGVLSRTMTGLLSTMKDNIGMAMATMFSPLFYAVENMNAELVKYLSSDIFQEWVFKIQGYVGALVVILPALYDVFSAVFGGILNVALTVGGAIYDAFSWINPFATHSPSLVSQVQDGFDLIDARIRQTGKVVPEQVTVLSDAMVSLREALASVNEKDAAKKTEETLGFITKWAPGAVEAFKTVNAEITRLKPTVEELKKTYEAQMPTVENLKDKLDLVKESIKEQEKALSLAEKGLQPYSDAVKEANKAVQDQQKIVESNSASLAPYRETINNVKEAIDAQQRAITLAERALTPYEQAVTAAKDAVDAQERVLRQANLSLAPYEQALNAAKRALDEKQNALTLAERAFRPFEAAVTSVKNALAIASEKVSDFEKSLQPVRDALANATAAVRTQEQAIAAAEVGLRPYQEQVKRVADEIARQELVIKNSIAALKPYRDAIDQAQKAVENQKNAIALAEKGLAPYSAAIEKAKSALSSAQQQFSASKNAVDTITASINAAKNAFNSFVTAPLEGSKKYSDALFANEIATKKLKLELLDLQNGGVGTGRTVDEVTAEIEKLSKEAEKISLTRDLELDPLRKQLQDTVDSAKELTFADAMSGALKAKTGIKELEDQLALAVIAQDNASLSVDNANKNLVDAEIAYAKQVQTIDVLKTQLDLYTQSVDTNKIAYQNQLDALSPLYDKLSQTKDAQELINQQYKDASAALDPMRQQLIALKDVQTAANIAADQAKKSVDEQKNSLIPLQNNVLSAEKALNTQKNTTSALKNEIVLLSDKVKDATLDLDAHKLAIEPVKQTLDALKLSQESATLALQAQKDQILPLRNELNNLKINLEDANFALQDQTKLGEPAIKTLNDLKDKAKEADAVFKLQNESLDGFRKNIKDLRVVLSDTQDAYDIENKKLGELKRNYDEVANAIKEYQSELDKIGGSAKAGATAAAPIDPNKKVALGTDPAEEEKIRKLKSDSEEFAKSFKKTADDIKLFATDIKTFFSDATIKLHEFIDPFVKELKPEIESMYLSLKANLLVAWKEFTDGLATARVWLAENLPTAIRLFKENILPLIKSLEDLALALYAIFKVIFFQLLDSIKDLYTWLGVKIPQVITTVKNNFEEFKAVLVAITVAAAGFGLAFILPTLGITLMGYAATATTLAVSAMTAVTTAFATITAIAFAPLTLIILGVSAAVGLLYYAWEKNFGGIREATAGLWAWLEPVLVSVYTWVSTKLGDAVKALSDVWTLTLLPALKNLWSWVKDNLVVLFKDITDAVFPFLQVAVAALVDFWNNSFLPAIKAVWAYFNDNIVPMLKDILVGAFDLVGKGIKILKDLWDTTLLPALKAVWSFVKDYLWPIFQSLVELGFNILKLAVIALMLVWNNVLVPALDFVWKFVRDYLWPIFQSIAGFFTGEMSAATKLLVNVFKNDLLPMLEKVWKFIDGSVLPIFRTVGDYIGGALLTGFNGIVKVLDALKSGLEWINTALGKIKFPALLTPGSPTPFEIGLRGINDALGDMNVDLSVSKTKFSGLQPSLPSASGLSGAKNYNVVVNTMDTSVRESDILRALSISDTLYGR